MGKFKNISSRLTNLIADQFYKIGIFVASNPWKTIITSMLIVIVCCTGFFKIKIERDPLQLWIPKDSKFLDTTKWILENIEIGARTEIVLITAPNVLHPTVLHKLLKIHNEIHEVNAILNNGTSIKWNDICLRIPFILNIQEQEKVTTNFRKRRSIDDIDKDDIFSGLFDEAGSLTETPKREFNPSVDLPTPFYCRLIKNLPWGCYEKNLLQLWKYDENNMKNLTYENVISKFENKTIVSPVTGHDTDYTELLGGITRNENGKIIGARAIVIQWLVQLNFTQVRKQRLGNLAGTEDWTTEQASTWEDSFLHKITELKNILDDKETTIYYSAGKSFGDISYKTMFKETDKLGIGIALMFIYIQIVLSKFSWTEFRFSLGGAGLLSVGLAFLSACGICSYIGVPYGPVHTSLPFLLMGLGVDDMFVMMACWRKVQHENCSIEERIGKLLKHAGASITVTSLTDIIAFLVGSLTVIPSLQSFCLYAAVGVFMTYFYALTFYLAVIVIDEYRIAARRNAFIPCIVHEDDKLKLCCDFNLMHKFLKTIYGKFVLTKIGKIIIIMSVIILTGVSSRNLLKLEQKFDPSWFIPDTTYLHKYIQASRNYFPDSGYQGSVFMGKLNYTESMRNISRLTIEIEEDQMYHHVQSWVKPFFLFVKQVYSEDLNKTILSDTEWKFYLSKFLFSPNGGKFQANFRFEKPLECGVPVSEIIASWIDFRFKKFSHRDDYLPAMKRLDVLVKDKHFNESGDGFAEVWSRAYANWITDEIIDREVYRNVLLALICVMFCTYIVIIDIQVCFWIFICVLLTLINVGGFLQMWGLTIDLVSCIALQLAVGLCVDYAAHIGHTFLVSSNGDRNQRVLDTILHIGAAVFYGGGSTLLSLLLLSQSEAYTFKSFFKIFLLVIVFGLFHGVVLLPVILSLIGPSPYNEIKQKQDVARDNTNCEEMKPMNTSVNTEICEKNVQNS